MTRPPTDIKKLGGWIMGQAHNLGIRDLANQETCRQLAEVIAPYIRPEHPGDDLVSQARELHRTCLVCETTTQTCSVGVLLAALDAVTAERDEAEALALQEEVLKVRARNSRAEVRVERDDLAARLAEVEGERDRLREALKEVDRAIDYIIPRSLPVDESMIEARANLSLDYAYWITRASRSKAFRRSEDALGHLRKAESERDALAARLATSEAERECLVAALADAQVGRRKAEEALAALRHQRRMALERLSPTPRIEDEEEP